jgi:hypothetical protein
MSTEQDKIKHSKRIHSKQTYTKRQVKIAKQLHGEPPKEAHVYHKVSAATCGNSNCVMCGNPRKFWGEQTMQEQRLFQEKLHQDEQSDTWE